MKTTYTLAQVPTARRVSPRAYTHAIIGRTDGALRAKYMREQRAANKAKINAWNRKTWEARQREAQAELGQPFRALNGYDTQPTQAGIDSARVFIATYPTYQEYQHSEDTGYETELAEAAAAGTSPTLEVLQWNQSWANAAKATPGFQRLHSDVQVVETIAA